MSDKDIVDTIADDFNCEIVGHSSDYNGGRLTYSRSRDLAQQAIFALRSAGYAVVQLPEPSEYTKDRGGMYNTYPFVGVKSDDITVGASCEFVYHINHHEARATGLALLAAADKAEEGK